MCVQEGHPRLSDKYPIARETRHTEMSAQEGPLQISDEYAIAGERRQRKVCVQEGHPQIYDTYQMAEIGGVMKCLHMREIRRCLINIKLKDSASTRKCL